MAANSGVHLKKKSSHPSPFFFLQIMSEYSSLLSDLCENITNEDLEQLKSACKEDIPEDQSNSITSSKEWFSYLEKNDKLAQGERTDMWEEQPLVFEVLDTVMSFSFHFREFNVLLFVHITNAFRAVFIVSADNLSYIERIFEISRRPDLLTRVIEYRTTVLKISEDDEIDTKLTRIPSAKKYKGINIFILLI